MPSHSYDSCFSRDSSSCAAFVEHHCDCLAIERAKEILGTGPGLMALLWELALRTRVVRSTGLRSEIERKCRGAKGEVAGVEGVELEYARL